MSSKSKVYFFFHEISFSLKDRGKLKKYIELLFLSERKQLESINYIFCTDAYLKKINKVYLNHDYYTDIITFDFSEKPSLISAEIYISIERIRDNAKKLGFSIKAEAHRVIFHGALHLCGYDDKSEMQKIKMRKKEDSYLSRYFIDFSRETA